MRILVDNALEEQKKSFFDSFDLFDPKYGTVNRGTLTKRGLLRLSFDHKRFNTE